MKLHTGETKYQCSLCDSAFIRSDHLKSHMKTHDLAKPFQCPLCNRGYATSAALTSHMQAHKSPNQLAKKLKHFVKYQAGILSGVNQQLVSALVKCNTNLLSSAINPVIPTSINNTNQQNPNSQTYCPIQIGNANQINSNKRSNNLMSINQTNSTNYNLKNKRRKLSVNSLETDENSNLSDVDDLDCTNLFDKNEVIDVCNNSCNNSLNQSESTELLKNSFSSSNSTSNDSSSNDETTRFLCESCGCYLKHKVSFRSLF